MSSAAAGALHFGYDPPDRLNSVVRPNGGNDTLVYDLAGQLSSQSTIANGQTLARLNYTYDAAGRRNGVTDLTCTTTLGYDPAGRLVSATHPASSGLAAESFTYDNEGNLTSQTDRSSGAVTRYTWNADHELLDVQRPDDGQVSYRYDALGRRIESNAGGVITRWVWDGSNVQLEYDASNTLQASYTTGLQAGTVMATTRSGQTTYSVQDVLRTTTTLLDASGHVSAAFAYSAFGQPAPSNPAPPAFGWAGLNRDSSTGLFFARARMYDSAAGRFIGEDPLPAANRYIYAANDPAQLIDPTGATLEEDVQLRSKDARTLIEEFAVQIKTGGLQGGERVMRILTELIKSTQGRQLVLDIHKVVAGVMGLYGSQMDPSEFRIFQIILNLTGHFPGLP